MTREAMLRNVANPAMNARKVAGGAVRNGFVPFIPIMLWNALLTDRLPAVYGSPAAFMAAQPELATAETVLRSAVMILAALMPLGIRGRRGRLGLALYLGGTAAYFASWLAVIAWPESAWSRSAAGFLAPAYLSFPWLLGIGLVSDRLYVRVPYRWWIYVALAVLFTVVHTLHFVTLWPGG